MDINRSTRPVEVVTVVTKDEPDGFILHLSDDEMRVIRFILISAYVDQFKSTKEITGVSNFAAKASDLGHQLGAALDKAGVDYELSPFVLEPR